MVDIQTVVQTLKGLMPGAGEIKTNPALIEKGDIFACLPCKRSDGEARIKEAMERGAEGFLTENPDLAEMVGKLPYVTVHDLALKLPMISALRAGSPWAQDIVHMSQFLEWAASTFGNFYLTAELDECKGAVYMMSPDASFDDAKALIEKAADAGALAVVVPWKVEEGAIEGPFRIPVKYVAPLNGKLENWMIPIQLNPYLMVSKLPESIGEQVRIISPRGSSIRLNSRDIKPGDVFMAVVGTKVDGRKYIPDAVSRGASCVVMEDDAERSSAKPEIPTFRIKDLGKQAGLLAAAFYREPSASMVGIAVTGTNGKTSTTKWISEMLTECAAPCGVIGTLGCFFQGQALEGEPLTTPDCATLQKELFLLKEKGAKAFAIEASSIGLEQGRMNGTRIPVAVFTNLTRDHLDYHKTMETYLEAKLKVLDFPGLQYAVINLDADGSNEFIQRAVEKGVRIWGYTCGDKKCQGETLKAENIRMDRDGLSFSMCLNNECVPVKTGLFGHFNVENLLAAAASCMAAGLTLAQAAVLMPGLKAPKGRLETVEYKDGPLVVVDYAHTPDALENVMATLQETAKARGGKLWVLVGCGGDRDPGKRPMMAEIASKADCPILTTDNPRTEDPEAILAEMRTGKGSEKASVIVDRAEAIAHAVKNAGPNDVVLIAGKGHEDYQEVNGVKHHFSDREEAEKALAQK